MDDQKLADAEEKKGRLVALHSLTLRNFVALCIKEYKEIKRVGESYRQDIKGDGAKTVVAATVVGVAGGVVGMVTALAAPIAAIAALKLMAWNQFPPEIDDLKGRGNPDDDKDDTGA